MKLTPQEEQTLDAYNANAVAFSTARNNEEVWLEEKKKFKEYLPNGKVLDIGSGNGRDAKVFLSAGYTYVGVDISDKLLAEARKENPQATFMQQSIYELQFPPQTFDGFWACAALLHMPKSRMNEALQSIHKAVKKGGIGFISLKKGEGERFVEGDHLGIQYKRFISFWQKDEFIKALQKIQFEVIESYETEHSNKPWLAFFVKVI